MLAMSNEQVPMVGGPFDGETRPFSSQSNMCITVVGPLSVRHEWYVLQSHGRLRNGQPEYRDRWVYIGHGSQHAPELK